MNDQHDDEQSFVERHARQRLHTVQKEKRKPYIKKKNEDPHRINWTQIILQILMIIVLASMILSIL